MPKKKSDGTQVATVSKNKTAKAKPVDPAAMKKLEEMENRIKAGIIKYFETGMLLQEISDKKLYKLRDCRSFKAYCEKVFHFSRSYGYRLIAYCNIWNLLSDDEKDKIPERVIRALSMVEDPTERQEIWDKVKTKTGGELPTYKTVEEEIRECRKQKQFTKANFDPASSPDKVFCMTLKKPVIQAELAQELIDNSNGDYGKLLNATREMLKANYLNDEAQQTLKQELLKRYSEWLDKQFGEKTSLDENDVEVSPMGDTFDSVQQ